MVSGCADARTSPSIRALAQMATFLRLAAQGSLKWHPGFDRYTLTAAGFGLAVGVGVTQASAAADTGHV